MGTYKSCVVLLACFLLVNGVVIPRPPASVVRYSRVMVVTSSELPKQIPAPSQSPHHSSTPQYHEETIWVGTATPENTLKAHKSYDQRTDLMPNMI